MPLLLHEPLHPPGEWGIWSISEEETALRNSILLFPREIIQLNAIRGEGRRREFLAARLLLHTMSGRGRRSELVKDDDGKPHLIDSPFHVSISHTHGYSAAIAHPRPCGVDIQAIVPRIRRLADRFVSPAEQSTLLPEHDLVQLHLIWSAKEAIYKAYGRRQLDFREHMFVDCSGYPQSVLAGNGTARLAKDDLVIDFALTYRVTREYVLVGVVAAATSELRSPVVE